MIFSFLKSGRSVLRPFAVLPALVIAGGVGASLVCAVPVQAKRQDPKDDSSYTIKRLYKVGDADRYKVTMKMNMALTTAPVDISEIMVMKETTKEAKEDGAAVLVFNFLSAVVTANGMEVDVASMLPTITTALDKEGKADVKIDGGNEQVTGQMGDQVKQFTNAATAAMPKKPVKVGDSWELNASDIGAPGQDIKGKATLVSIETIKGMKVGKIRAVTEMTGDKGLTMHTVATSFIVLATGKALNVTSNAEGFVAGAKIHAEMVMKMLDPEEKSDTKATVKTDPEVKKP